MASSPNGPGADANHEPTASGGAQRGTALQEAAQVTVRSDQEWCNKYFHLAMRRGRKIAKVAMARRLAFRMYWIWRKGWEHEQLKKFGSHAGQPGHRDGVRENSGKLIGYPGER